MSDENNYFENLKLKDVATVIMGQSPDSSSYNQEQKGFPFLQGCSDFGVQYPQTNNYCSLPLKIAPKQSILISVRAPVGDINISDKDYCIGRGLAAIVSDESHINYIYYYLLLQGDSLKKFSQGSTFKAINFQALNEFDILIPSNRHRLEISKILFTIDNTIEKTEALIEKYQKVKEGMMQDLFTRGIGEDDKLRPPYHKTPELYKETELGVVPKEWVIEPISEHASVLVGYAFKSEDYCQDGIPLIRIGNLFNNQLDMNREPVYLPHTFKDKFNNYLLEPNDMIISMTGTLGKRDYGFVVRIPKKSNQIYFTNR